MSTTCGKLATTVLLCVCALVSSLGASDAATNRPERLEWFRDQGFGLFIHWSVDSQLGVVISHSLVGASEDYAHRFFTDLPASFYPRNFNAPDLAALAKLAGVRYVVFTAKHHSGFCMWNTATTDFSIRHTPFRRDLTAEILDAFRAQGIAPGLYFSPDDFLWLYKNKKTIQRRIPEVQPLNNPGLMEYDLAQVRELMTKYGNIDVVFFDGQADKLRDLAWELQPNTVVTRGAIQTPEKTIPGQVLDGAWESCITMGDGWQYQPMLENYKSAADLIQMLIEIRAKGGNLLLNVGPKPDGELPIEQEERLREIGLWMFVNGEGIYGVRPWAVPNDNGIWYTRKKDGDTVYAFLTHKDYWKLGERREFVLHSVRAGKDTEIAVLGQNDKAVEYQSTVPKTTWRQEADGLHVQVTLAQRLRDHRQWSYPVVLKITNALAPESRVRVETVAGKFDPAKRTMTLSGNVLDLAGAPEVEVGFEYRDITGQDTNERTSTWQQTPLQRRSAAGLFSAGVEGIDPNRTYEFRGFVQTQSGRIFGGEMQLQKR